MKKWDHVCVEWQDAHVDTSALNSVDYLTGFKGCIRRTMGFYMGETGDYTFLCETDDRRAQLENCDVERITAIPNGMIVKCTHLLPAKGRRQEAGDGIS